MKWTKGQRKLTTLKENKKYITQIYSPAKPSKLITQNSVDIWLVNCKLNFKWFNKNEN